MWIMFESGISRLSATSHQLTNLVVGSLSALARQYLHRPSAATPTRGEISPRQLSALQPRPAQRPCWIPQAHAGAEGAVIGMSAHSGKVTDVLDRLLVLLGLPQCRPRTVSRRWFDGGQSQN
jgi:hypothetical protein